MSALTKSLHPDEKIKAGKLGTNMAMTGLAIAVVFGIISLVLGSMHGDHMKRFLHAYVVGWAYIVSLSIGILWIVLLHHLVRGRWVTVVRRIAEAMSMAMPVIFIAGLGFALPVALGYKDLYYWAHPDAHIATLNPSIVHKASWLSPGFWFLRYCLYGVVLTGIAWYFAKKSREQDESGDPNISQTLRIAAGPLMILYSFATVFLAWDVLMSISPKWYSTIY